MAVGKAPQKALQKTLQKTPRKAPLSGQARNAVISANLRRVRVADLESRPDYRGVLPQAPAIDPATAYGCVDWYLYPQTTSYPLATPGAQRNEAARGTPDVRNADARTGG